MLIAITNNKSIVAEKEFNVEFVEGEHIDVLEKVRAYVHLGGKLVTPPLFPSSSMHRSPYRTVLLEKPMDGDTAGIDEVSVNMIESGIEQYRKYMNVRKVDYRNQADYAFMDRELYISALEELKREVNQWQ